MVKVIINEQHGMMESQEKLLGEVFGEYEEYKVPASGWSVGDMERVQKELEETTESVVFLSPVPVLLGKMSAEGSVGVYVLHNDRRQKKELPNGKVIMVVAEEGWELIKLTG